MGITFMGRFNIHMGNQIESCFFGFFVFTVGFHDLDLITLSLMPAVCCIRI